MACYNQDIVTAHAAIQIHCAYTRLADPKSLRPNPRNPNRHPTAQVKLLADLVRGHGWRAPIAVSRRSGFIVRGHGRLDAALLLGVSEVPVDDQDYASDAAEYADLLADNKIAELAELDRDALARLVKSLPQDAWRMTGFSDIEIADILTSEWKPPQVGDMPSAGVRTEVIRLSRDEAETVLAAAGEWRLRRGAETSTDAEAVAAIAADFLGSSRGRPA